MVKGNNMSHTNEVKKKKNLTDRGTKRMEHNKKGKLFHQNRKLAWKNAQRKINTYSSSGVGWNEVQQNGLSALARRGVDNYHLHKSVFGVTRTTIQACRWAAGEDTFEATAWGNWIGEKNSELCVGGGTIEGGVSDASHL